MSNLSPRNLLLRRLPLKVVDAVLKSAELVHLDQGDPIYEPDQEILYVDFPETGVMSMVAVMDNAPRVEIATIGNEGMLGISAVFGVYTNAEQTFCQVNGTAHRLDRSTFIGLVDQFPELKAICQRYIIVLFNQISRNSGCFRSHSTEQRCARWLLLTEDRCGKSTFGLTQEFLSIMLGVSRTGVNAAAGALSKAGLIKYVRGKVTIVDRPNLKLASCSCYDLMNEYYARIILSDEPNARPAQGVKLEV
ncbi:MAG: helix-turn-helix domain-containing protein [Cyanobacteria bacterium REEB67]|nr:helix-turn-helix domain-containing protein [Cyanobacteria bacterium REEB67]